MGQGFMPNACVKLGREFLRRYLCFKKVIVHHDEWTKCICEPKQTTGIKVAILSLKSSHATLMQSLWLKFLWGCFGPCLSDNPRIYRYLRIHSHGQRSKDWALKAPENKQCWEHLCRVKSIMRNDLLCIMHQRILKNSSICSHLGRGSSSLEPKTIFLKT